MKIILSSKRHHYLAKFSIFLITAALIAGMVGCGDTPLLLPKTWKYGIGMIWMPSETTWVTVTF